MRIRLALTALVAAALVLAGCGSDDSSAPAPSTTTSADAGSAIPSGTWTRHVARDEALAEARRLGIGGPAVVDEVFGSFERELAIIIKIDDGSWAQFQSLDGGTPTLGDSGTSTYDESGALVTVSDSTGCPGCTGRLDWTVDGDRLTLALADGGEPADAGVANGGDAELELAIARFVTEGTYEREPADG